MRKSLFAVLLLMLFHPALASGKDSTVYYHLHDSVRAIQFMAEISVQAVPGKKEVFAGIKTDAVTLLLEADKKEREIVFGFPRSATAVVNGMNTDATEKGEIGWKYNWALNKTYKLLLAVATDSAENFSVYSGYIWLPEETKWKLIGTCIITGRWNTMQQPASFLSRKNGIQMTTGQVWIQRSNGSWKNLSPGSYSEKNENMPTPLINLSGHVDSVSQRQTDIRLIEDAITLGKTDVRQNEQGVYYTIMKEGAGRQISLNDTIVAHYKGYLFADGTIFDQTKDKPATFPLKRLIRGWQIGVPLCKVGGKIKLVIPSDLSYSIRTRAAKIPPNSILVFEVEVVDVKPAL